MTSQKIALVTGANRGIGYEICRQLARMNMQVILTARDSVKGQIAVEKLGQPNVEFFPLDVADSASVQAISEYVQSQYGRLDVLVNNAGIYPDEGVSVFDISLALLKETFEINTFGAFLTCQAFVPLMQKHNYGRVVNVSSGAGAITDMGGYLAAYKLSKVALNALTRIVADEVRRYNIKVNAMCPGWVRTDMGGANAPRSVEEGADTAIWLATLPDNGPTNGFFRDRQPIDW